MQKPDTSAALGRFGITGIRKLVAAALISSPSLYLYSQPSLDVSYQLQLSSRLVLHAGLNPRLHGVRMLNAFRHGAKLPLRQAAITHQNNQPLD